MPKLPEVESFRRRFATVALHREVAAVEVLDAKVLRGCTAMGLETFLLGYRMMATQHRGKYFFALREGSGALHIHLGMTGVFRLFDPVETTPRFSRVILHFRHGPSLAYTDARKFGRFHPVENPEDYLTLAGVGPDALEIGEAEFLERIDQRRGLLKAALLDQRLVAGLGNLWIDEICMATGIHPGSRLERPARVREGHRFDSGLPAGALA